MISPPHDLLDYRQSYIFTCHFCHAELMMPSFHRLSAMMVFCPYGIWYIPNSSKILKSSLTLYLFPSKIMFIFQNPYIHMKSSELFVVCLLLYYFISSACISFVAG